MAGSEGPPRILVWFEDNPRGRAALDHAQELAEARQGQLTVLTVALRERVVGCGRCLQGTVLWNIEMRKIAQEELVTARDLLGDATDADFELIVGSPAEAIAVAAERIGAQVIVLPEQLSHRLGPRSRRNIAERVASHGSWQVVAARTPRSEPVRA